MLSAGNITVQVNGRQILRDVSVQILPGRFTTVVGPNGAGKSTLLRVLSNDIRAYEGRVTINGNPLQTFNSKAMSQVRSVLPQHSQIQFAFSVEQIVQLGRHAHVATRTENAAIVDEVMELTGISSFRRRVYQTLSGGERQRVQLARVLAQVWEQTVFPRYLLLDEPTSSLDIAQQDIIFTLARAACARNIGVMAIIHDLNQAVQFADDMLFLRDGKTVAIGAPRTTFTKANIEETFSCPVSLYHLPDREHPVMVPGHGAGKVLPVLKVSNQSNKQ